MKIPFSKVFEKKASNSKFLDQETILENFIARYLSGSISREDYRRNVVILSPRVDLKKLARGIG
jgi:hypothetical protein